MEPLLFTLSLIVLFTLMSNGKRGPGGKGPTYV